MGKWKKRIGYGVGDLGCNLVFSTMASYLMVFYTDVFGITAAAVGTMMLVTKFIDALTDTGMGMIVDRTHTKWGQGRPYFLFGAIPFAVFTMMTFFIPDFGSTGKLVWAYVTYCLLCTAYTVVNIPLNTIVPRLTSDIHERDVLVSTRMVCAMIGTAIVMTITTPLVKFFGAGKEARGYFLKSGGYIANEAQTPMALYHIEICFIWIPIVLCILLAVVTAFYKLDRIRSQMTIELEGRRVRLGNEI